MSHELKTPLNAVIGFSDIMRQQLFGPVGEERYRGYVVDIHENGRRLLAMINDILDLSRIEGRLLDLDEDAVNVQEAVTVACNSIVEDKPDAPPIHIDIPAHLPLLKVDPRRLHQILTHLLSNAVKFTPSQGRISVRSMLSGNGAVTIAISDTGIGMDPDRIGHALEPFKQLDSRLARRFEGVGLGLPLANALVRAHEGTLSIESAPGTGTTVTVSFPPQRNVEIARAACA
jgi:signal transduction histidine kinase